MTESLSAKQLKQAQTAINSDLPGSVVAVVCSVGTHGKICLKTGATVYGTLVNLR